MRDVVLRMRSNALRLLRVQYGEPFPAQLLFATDEILVQGWPLSSSCIFRTMLVEGNRVDLVS